MKYWPKRVLHVIADRLAAGSSLYEHPRLISKGSWKHMAYALVRTHSLTCTMTDFRKKAGKAK